MENTIIESVYTEVIYNDITNIVKREDTRNSYDSFSRSFNPEKLLGCKPGEYYFRPPLLSFGDYDNSCQVERSNVRLFLEAYGTDPAVIHLTGGYGSESIYIDISCSNTEIIETLQGLENYPCINDEDLSNLESEVEREVWDNCYASDFLDLLKKKFEGDDIECNDLEKLWELYRELSEALNLYAVHESGGNCYIDVEKLVESIDTLPDFITIEKY